MTANPGGPTHGQLLRHATTRTKGLEGFGLSDLAAEVLFRLANATAPASYADHHHLIALLGELRDACADRVEVQQNRLSIVNMRNHARVLQRCLQKHDVPLRGATHLDLGCGSINPYGRMFTHLLFGAERGLCLELDPVQDLGQAVRFLARLAGAALLDPAWVLSDAPLSRSTLLANLRDVDLAKLQKGDPAGIEPRRLELLSRPLAAAKLPAGSVQFAVSNSVLEHVVDLDAVVGELARVTAPGGYGMHGIDTSDHRRFADPRVHALEFLTLASDQTVVHGCNRERMWQHAARFERHGFDVVDRWEETLTDVPPALRQRLAAPWASMSDAQLGMTWCILLVRRR